jgi:chromosome partitioning protein
MKTIVLANAKGGTGKTTCAVNLSACLASRHGKRVLGIDLDPQGNFGISFGIDPRQITHTSYQLLTADSADPKEYIVPARQNLDLIPCAIAPELENRLEASHNRDSLLRLKLRLFKAQYDYIVIDTPPAMRTATMNAIVAADEIVVVVDAGFYALYGLTELMRQIAKVSEAYEKDDIVIRGLLNKFERGTTLSRDVKNEVTEFFGGLMIQTVIHKNVRLAEAPSASLPIIEYDSSAPGAFDFLKLTKELLAEYEPETQARSTRKTR